MKWIPTDENNPPKEKHLEDMDKSGLMQTFNRKLKEAKNVAYIQHKIQLSRILMTVNSVMIAVGILIYNKNELDNWFAYSGVFMLALSLLALLLLFYSNSEFMVYYRKIVELEDELHKDGIEDEIEDLAHKHAKAMELEGYATMFSITSIGVALCRFLEIVFYS